MPVQPYFDPSISFMPGSFFGKYYEAFMNQKAGYRQVILQHLMQTRGPIGRQKELDRLQKSISDYDKMLGKATLDKQRAISDISTRVISQLSMIKQNMAGFRSRAAKKFNAAAERAAKAANKRKADLKQQVSALTTRSSLEGLLRDATGSYTKVSDALSGGRLSNTQLEQRLRQEINKKIGKYKGLPLFEEEIRDHILSKMENVDLLNPGIGQTTGGKKGLKKILKDIDADKSMEDAFREQENLTIFLSGYVGLLPKEAQAIGETLQRKTAERYDIEAQRLLQRRQELEAEYQALRGE